MHNFVWVDFDQKQKQFAYHMIKIKQLQNKLKKKKEFDDC